jgi:hypothetical protein
MAENRSFRKPEGVTNPSAVRVIQRTVVPARERKIFQPRKAENRFSNTLPAQAAARTLHETRQHSNGEPLRLLPREALNPTAGQDAEPGQVDQTRCTLNLLESRPSPDHFQFTNRRSRTLFTSPSIKNIATIFEPPELISGRGMPVTGIRPTTIPTFTNT